MMNLSAYQSGQLYTHYKVTKVVDGDGLIVSDIFSGNEIEIRLLGIDAPEIKKCKKLIQDERELHLPGELLIELGRVSLLHLRSVLPVGTPVSFFTENKNTTDIYGRTLAYVFLPSGESVNELLLQEGLVKPFNRLYCTQQINYQLLHSKAKLEKKGHFAIVEKF